MKKTGPERKIKLEQKFHPYPRGNMADYWFKFYTEVIDDPKMGLLPDRLWRRFFELCALAKRANQDGRLPGVKDLAWMLRLPEDELAADLEGLGSRG